MKFDGFLFVLGHKKSPNRWDLNYNSYFGKVQVIDL
jgi:hypothetical protein